MAVDICLIQVPFMAGDGAHPAAEGPGRYLRAGAERLLAGGGIRVTSRRAEVPAGTLVGIDVPSASRAVNRQLRPLVQAAVAARQLPVVLAGSCDVCMGVLAGMERKRCGMVWIDAHADFNTPESTVSGFFPGMSAAVITGHCYASYWGRIGDNTPVSEEAFVMFGVRELSPDAERERLERSSIRVVRWHGGRPEGDVSQLLKALRERVAEVYLHIDFDAFAPEVAPGVADDPVPGGLTFEDAEKIVRDTAERFRIRAVTLATYTPECDANEKTLRVGLRLIDVLAECAERL